MRLRKRAAHKQYSVKINGLPVSIVNFEFHLLFAARTVNHGCAPAFQVFAYPRPKLRANARINIAGIHSGADFT